MQMSDMHFMTYTTQVEFHINLFGLESYIGGAAFRNQDKFCCIIHHHL